MFRKNNFLAVVLIILCSINGVFSEEVDPQILYDLGKLKGISERYHNQHSPALSEGLKQDHNQLAYEVNAFIESIETLVERENVDREAKESLETKRRAINSKANSLEESLKNYKDKKLQSNFKLEATASLAMPRIIKTAIEWIKSKSIEMISYVLSKSTSEEKNNFINKLQQKRWIIIS
ncbi:MAG: hypothetical protein ACOH2E_06610 [Candidatus Paracaedibacter sp.]